MKLRHIVIVLLLLVACLILYTLYKAGSFKKIDPRHNGVKITYYTNMPGPEDLDIGYNTNTLFISSTDRRTGVEGGIFRINLKNQRSQPIEIPNTYKGSIHPHGISVFDSDSSTYLHVVNHNSQGDFIEFFEYRNDTLFHLKSISSSMMCCPNDVVAVAPDRCYVTNDHGNKSGFIRTLEDYLSLPLSGIVYYDGDNFIEAYQGMSYANGINISLDGKYLFATETTGRKLLTFLINPDASLTQVKSMNLKSGLDNIDIDKEGNIWIGSHPKMLDFVDHATDATKLSPSQVFKITPDHSVPVDYTVEEVFLDDGTLLSGSSVAVLFDDAVYVGVVFDNKVMRLQLK